MIRLVDGHLVMLERVTEKGLRDAWDMETLIQKEHGDKYRYKPKLKGTKETARDWRLGPSECFSEQLTPELLQNIFLAE